MCTCTRTLNKVATQDFLARMGGGRLFDMGASAVKYGIYFVCCIYLINTLQAGMYGV